MMYVLTQLIPRAKTTDTSIIAVSDSKEKLENYLSEIIEQAKTAHNEEDYLSDFGSTFSIHEVKYL